MAREPHGGLIRARHARREGDVAYLETDKLQNVVFYERFGFETLEERLVLGVPNWFMRRDPR